MDEIELTDQERRAINDFLGEHWGEFVAIAERFLDAEEIDALGENSQASDPQRHPCVGCQISANILQPIKP